jgi:hypothetical protein
MKYSRTASLLAALMALAGCADQPLNYVPPAGLTAQNGASITGSLVQTGALANNEKVFIGEVDNQVTTQNGSNLDVPLLVSPGLHVLQIVTCECGLWLRSVSGSVSVAVNLQPGQNYVARAGIPTSQWLMFDPNKTTTAWLEDGHGKMVAAPQQATLTAPPGPVFVPIIVPVH